jgi:hypothetical protein
MVAGYIMRVIPDPRLHRAVSRKAVIFRLSAVKS